MTHEILLPNKPRIEDPLAAFPVQDNVEHIARLFTLGDVDGDVPVWDSTLGQFVAGSVSPSTLAQDGATTGQALVWNGSAWVPTTLDQSVKVIVQNNGDVTGGTSSTGEFDVIANTSIPGGTLGANGRIVIMASGTMDIDSGSVTWRIYWGGSVRWAAADTFTNPANSPWNMAVVIAGRNATGTQRVSGNIFMSDFSPAASVGLGGFREVNRQGMIATADIAVDSTSAQDVRVTAQFSASDPQHHVTRDHLTILSEKL